jgi:mono/diheme cytochrome c family protein
LAEALATADPAALAVGQAAYRRECASCHGARGEGQPAWQIPLAGGSLPAPPHDSSGHTWHHPDGLLLDIIAYGGAIYSPTSAMPAFAGKLSPAEMRAVLAYIKTFWGERERAAQQEQTLQWELMQRQVTPDAEPSATALPSD